MHRESEEPSCNDDAKEPAGAPGALGAGVRGQVVEPRSRIARRRRAERKKRGRGGLTGASRTSYTIEKAIVVAEEAIRTGNQSAVADKYKVGSASVSRWVKRLSTLHKAAADGIRKRLRLGGGARPRCQWPKVEDKLFAELKVHRRGQPPPRPARSPPPLRLPSRLMPLVCALAGARAGG